MIVSMITKNIQITGATMMMQMMMTSQMRGGILM